MAPLDLSLYLVTDSAQLPLNTSLPDHVRAAIAGGVSLVQLREKSLNTAPFIKLGKEVHAVTKALGVPLLINDRVDVALAVGCEGVHIGWNDIDYDTARRLLGPTAIIGISVSNLDQVSLAFKTTCQYIGIGPVFPTPTKPDHNPALGISGVRSILERLESLEWKVPTVAIGGLNASNLQRTIFQSATSKISLDGIAVVSSIMKSPDPESHSKMLRNLLDTKPRYITLWVAPRHTPGHFWPYFNTILKNFHISAPVIHHITNSVVKSFSANVTLAIGASPIMSEEISEFDDLARASDALVVNMGTPNKDSLALFTAAITANNNRGNPVVFDPVGAGASQLRKDMARRVLDSGYCDVIKGNEGEIRSIAGEEELNMRGVDAGESSGDLPDLARLVKSLALREHNIILLTGPVDIISDGKTTYYLKNGTSLQSKSTGIGCALSSVIAAFLAAAKSNRLDKIAICLVAVSAYNIAAEHASKENYTHGPASWKVGFLDHLSKLNASVLYKSILCERFDGRLDSQDIYF